MELRKTNFGLLAVCLMLRRHSRLASRRSPLYEQSQIALFFTYLAAFIYVGDLILFALVFGLGLGNLAVEPYHVVNSGLLYVFAFDFLTRYSFQKLPTQEAKPYLLLPMRRQWLFDYLLARSAFSAYNLFWLFFYMPFALLTVIKFYGMAGVLTYCLGICLLAIVNNYLYVCCKLLQNMHVAWLLLPIALYGIPIAWMILADECPVYDWCTDLGEGFIQGNVFWFALLLVLIAALCLAARKLLDVQTYGEQSKAEDSKVKHVAQFSFFDRFGEMGQFMRLEMKLLLRNKMPRRTLLSVSFLVVLFAVLLIFPDIYQGGMRSFLIMYNYVIYALCFLNTLMSYEGNYIDALMIRKQSVYSLLQAKYVLYALGMFIPTLLLTPSMVWGSVPLLECLAWQAFVSGVVFFALFQIAVYNKVTIATNALVTGRNSLGSGIQNIIGALSFGVPLALSFTLRALLGPIGASVVLLVVGLLFMATFKLWLKNVYTRFMSRRYANMDGFRNSRQR